MFRFKVLFWSTLVLSAVLPFSARADMSGTATVQASGGTYNFDAGATPGCAGDISISVPSVTNMAVNAIGTAGLYGVPGAGGSTEFDSLTEADLQNLPYTTSALTFNGMAYVVFAVHTNAGHYAKVLVTAVSSATVTLQYLTYGVTPGAPVILQVRNNYSSQGSIPIVPFSGIAPGSLFVVAGCGLATAGSQAVLQDSTQGLPLTLNGASLSVQVNGVTTQPALYYAMPTQIAAVLPSAAPAGANATITASNAQASSSAPLVVQPAAFGFDTYYGTGAGMAVATDAGNQLLTLTNAASPGQTIVLWGSGLGAGADSDIAYTPAPHPISVSSLPLQILIGGIPASISYQGRSPYPGLDQIDAIVPPGVPTGCAVSLVAANGSLASISNFVTLPVAANGGACTDPLMGVSVAQAESLSTKSTVNIGVLTLEQGLLLDSSGAAQTHFFSIPGSSLTSWLAQQYAGANADFPLAGMPVSLGSCVVGMQPYPPAAWPAVYWYQMSPLDVGFMAVNTLAGTTWLGGEYSGSTTLPTEQTAPLGFASDSYLGFAYTGGAFTFAGSGGNDVSAFHTTLSFPMQETFPGISPLSPVPLVVNSSGQTFTWIGGSANEYITFSGSNGNYEGDIFGAGYASFTCNAPASAGQFTIPASVLLPMELTASRGILTVMVNTLPQPFSAPGLDAGYALGLIIPLSVPVVWH